MLLVTSMSCFQPSRQLRVHFCVLAAMLWTSLGNSFKLVCFGEKRDLMCALIHLVLNMYLHWWGRMAWGCEEGVENGNGFFRGLTGRKIKGWWQIDLEWAKKSTAAKFMGFKCSWPGVAAFHFSTLMQKGNSNLFVRFGKPFFSAVCHCVDTAVS